MRYEYFKHTINVENNVTDAYGIILFSNCNEVLRIHDVSTDINKIKILVSSLNDKRLSPFKLGEVLEQYINQENFI